jgi:hypothetical protein
MTASLPAGSRKCCDTRPPAAVPKRSSGRSRSPRIDRSTITSPATRPRTQISPGARGTTTPTATAELHNHSPPTLTTAPVQISSSPRTVGLRAPSRRGPLGRRARRGPAAWSPRRSVPADEGRTTARLCQRGTVAVAAARTSTPRPLMFAGQCHGQTPRCAGRRQRRCLGRRSRLLPALRVRGRQAIRTRAAAEQHRPILSRTEPIAFYGAASRPRE